METVKKVKRLSDYKILTKAVREEFIDILEFTFTSKASNMRWDESYYSKNRNFVLKDGGEISFIQCSSRDYHYILSDKSYTIFIGNDSDVKIVRNIKDVARSYMISDLGFDGARMGTEFLKKKAIEDEVNAVISAVSNGEINRLMNDFTLPNKPHSLKIGRLEGTIEYINRGNLVTMKAGKGIRKFLKYHNCIISDEQIKNFSNRMNTKLTDFTLKVVEGEDIDKYYYYKSYDNSFQTGSLQSSCMRGDDAQDCDFFKVYKGNAKMLIYVNEKTDLIIGRAILWDCARAKEGDKDEEIEEGDNVFVMDRIYSAESVYGVFKDWAKENGYYRKRYQSYNNETLFRSPTTGNEVELVFEMDICLNDYDNVPYMDTFAWGCDDVVVNYDGYGHYTARSTEGILEGGDNENDSWDDDDDDDDDCEWLD